MSNRFFYRSIIWIILNILFLFACQRNNKFLNNKTDDSLIVKDKIVDIIKVDSFENFKTAKKNNVFKYTIDTTDPQKFGFEEGDGPGLGPVSIKVSEDGKIFIVDNYHGNIKCIEISSGKIVYSTNLQYPIPWIRDITIFHNNIYGVSDWDTLYIFNQKLELLNKKKLSFLSDFSINFFLDKTDSLVLYNSKSSNKIFIRSLNTDTIIYSSEKHAFINFSFDDARKKYSISKVGEESYFCSNDLKVKLKYPIPNIFYHYDGINIDYNNKYLVYFGIEEGLMSLYIIEY